MLKSTNEILDYYSKGQATTLSAVLIPTVTSSDQLVNSVVMWQLYHNDKSQAGERMMLEHRTMAGVLITPSSLHSTVWAPIPQYRPTVSNAIIQATAETVEEVLHSLGEVQLSYKTDQLNSLAISEYPINPVERNIAWELMSETTPPQILKIGEKNTNGEITKAYTEIAVIDVKDHIYYRVTKACWSMPDFIVGTGSDANKVKDITKGTIFYPNQFADDFYVKLNVPIELFIENIIKPLQEKFDTRYSRGVWLNSLGLISQLISPDGLVNLLPTNVQSIN